MKYEKERIELIVKIAKKKVKEAQDMKEDCDDKI